MAPLLVIADAPGPIGAVEMTFPKPTTGTTGLESQVKREVDATPARQSAPVALGSYLPHSSGKAARPPSMLAAETT